MVCEVGGGDKPHRAPTPRRPRGRAAAARGPQGVSETGPVRRERGASGSGSPRSQRRPPAQRCAASASGRYGIRGRAASGTAASRAGGGQVRRAVPALAGDLDTGAAGEMQEPQVEQLGACSAAPPAQHYLHVEVAPVRPRGASRQGRRGDGGRARRRGAAGTDLVGRARGLQRSVSPVPDSGGALMMTRLASSWSFRTAPENPLVFELHFATPRCRSPDSRRPASSPTHPHPDHSRTTTAGRPDTEPSSHHSTA